MRSIRVAILSDTRLFGESLAASLAHEAGLLVVGTTGTPSRGGRHAAADVLLVDARMEGALRVCADLRRDVARPRAILLAADTEGPRATQALEAGVRGLLAKGACRTELLKAIRVVHKGQVWASQEAVARSLDELSLLSEGGYARESLLAARLSPREKDVARLAASGLANKQIADRLGISSATVKAHLGHVFEKLAVSGRAALAALIHGFPNA